MLLQNANVLCGDFIFRRASVRLNGSVIAAIESSPAPRDEPIFDCAGGYLIPGLVDLHTHGCVGRDYSDGDPEGFAACARYLAQNGVTSFLPTTMSLSEETLTRVFGALGAYIGSKQEGAVARGINMEGPFFNPTRKGAQSGEWLKLPDYAMFERLYEASGQTVKMVDFAPELPGGLSFIEQAREKAVLSIAHSDATYEQARDAIGAGITHATHLFNAMPPLLHREPGAVGAVLDSAATAEVICDGGHIHPALVRSLFRLLGGRLVMISDSMRATGMPDGVYDLGGQEVFVKEGLATLRDGTVAGSTTNLMECVRRTASFGVPLAEAVRAASLVPARVIGLQEEIGSLEAGKRADCVLLDRGLAVQKVFLGGVLFGACAAHNA